MCGLSIGIRYGSDDLAFREGNLHEIRVNLFGTGTGLLSVRVRGE